MQINANKCTKSNETTFVTNESWTSETNNQNSSHYMGKLMQSNMLDQVAFQCCDWKNNNISRPVDIQKTWYNLKINLSLSPVMSVSCLSPVMSSFSALPPPFSKIWWQLGFTRSLDHNVPGTELTHTWRWLWQQQTLEWYSGRHE